MEKTRADIDRDLLRRYHEEGDVAAREELVQRHLPLVRSLARRFAGRGESLEDLEQVGAIGLIKAIDRFEMAREVALTSYATPNVVGEIKRHFRDRGSAIRIPRNLKELSAKLGKAMERLTAREGRSPTIAELAADLDTTPEQVLEALEAGSARSTVSLSSGTRRRRPRPDGDRRRGGRGLRPRRGPRVTRARDRNARRTASARSSRCGSRTG